MKQQTLAIAPDQNAQYEQYRKPTRRDLFLATMDKLVPWDELCSVIEPHYPKAGNGRPPVGLQRMLRMYFVQHWFNLADAACEDALLDSTALRRFVGIDLGRERVPDATTLLKFRRLLEKHDLAQAMFAKVGEVLQSNGLKVGTGTIVDATIIGAPSSTKNADGERDPEMHQTRKGSGFNRSVQHTNHCSGRRSVASEVPDTNVLHRRPEGIDARNACGHRRVADARLHPAYTMGKPQNGRA
jgi:IS5 family transposase